MLLSPYRDVPTTQWQSKTQQLITEHPLSTTEIVEVTLKVWEGIFRSEIGDQPFKIGFDLFPRPQIMAYFLHELIPLEFAHRYPDRWRREQTVAEKDLVYRLLNATGCEMTVASVYLEPQDPPSQA